MALRFPRQPDVRLMRAPLAEVICQVRFPAILRIGEQEPVEFQEKVRGRFPEFEIEQGVMLFRLAGQPNEAPVLPELPPKAFRFQTADKTSTIVLARDFFALSSGRYTIWNEFANDLRLLAEAVDDCYRPAYGTRIGLRYVNRLTPANTGQRTSRKLLGLLRPELTSLLRSDAWTEPDEFGARLVIRDGPGKLGIQTRYGLENAEPYFMLDFDYFEEGELALGDLISRCDRYHQVIYDAFRWCIREVKLSVFNPVGDGAT